MPFYSLLGTGYGVLSTALLPGRTYTLTDPSGDSNAYYQLVRDLADQLRTIFPHEIALRNTIRRAFTWKGLPPPFRGAASPSRKILRELERVLSPYLTGVDEHLRSLTLTDRWDRTMRTTRDQYLLSMLEIELTNRITRQSFLDAPWRMALIAHCLRDFREGCRSAGGDVEEQCAHCESACHVNLGSKLLEKYGVHPYISVSMDHRRLFRQLKEKHPGMGVLGIACVPELVAGLRLCESLGIPAVGVPLDANRCSRWLGECLETTFNLEELERLIKPVPSS